MAMSGAVIATPSMAALGPSLDSMEARLREIYGPEFEPKFKESLAEYGVRRGALNALRTRETEAELTGLFVNTISRRSMRGETKGQINQVSFRVLTPEGRPTLVIAARDSIDWVKAKFPNIPGRLVPVNFAPVLKREDVISGATTFFVIPAKTLLGLVPDTGDLDLELPVSTITEAVRRQEQKKSADRDPFSIIYGSITDVRSFVDQATGELESVKATLEDMNGDTINAKLEDNIAELLGDKSWVVEAPEPEKIRNALRGTPVLLGGRVFIGHAGDELKNRATGEVSVLADDVVSFVVKNGGYIVDLETVSPSVYAAVMKSLERQESGQ